VSAERMPLLKASLLDVSQVVTVVKKAKAAGISQPSLFLSFKTGNHHFSFLGDYSSKTKLNCISSGLMKNNN